MIKSGCQLILEERLRQEGVEGFTAEHDDLHSDGQLAMAAACYANPSLKDGDSKLPYDWPWEDKWWKPTPNDRIRELAKAGALIAAEIDRLQRKEA